MLKRYISLCLTVFLIVSSLTFMSATSSKAHAENTDNESRLTSVVTSKVATYNMAAGSGMDGEYDLDRIADTIRETEADIIGLQEVDVHWGSRSDYENTIEKLADKLDMHYFFAPIYDFDPLEEGDERRQYGVGVLSKYPIKNAYNREITRLSTQDPDPEPKLEPGFLEAQLDVEGEDVWFYVTHLDYRGDPTVREMQVEDMFDHMAEHPYSILVGDLNANPDAPELQPVFQWFNDAWDINLDDKGYTFPADEPIKRIDYVLTSPRMDVNSTKVTDSLASDHLPVTADISFRGEHSDSLKAMRSLAEKLANQDELADEETAHSIDIHLAALEHYEQQSNATKIVKHLENFKTLLDYQMEKEHITDRTYTELYADTEFLINQWNKE